MARKLRLQFPGAFYHLTNRGNRSEDIFRDDDDRETFLTTLGEACAKSGWHVHAFCLLPNHFHLVVETPLANLTAGMKWFLGTYTLRFNRRHQLTGHLFAGRFKAVVIGDQGGYLRAASDHVHLNPARAALVSKDTPLRHYRWSSLPFYLQAGNHRPRWLQVDRLFSECGIAHDNVSGRRRLEDYLEARRRQQTEEEFQPLRRGWCFGDAGFRQGLLVQAEPHKNHFGPEVAEFAEAKANRIVDEELRRALWTEPELSSRRKGDPEKIAIARRLRAETTMTMEWIAKRLHMGTRTHLNHLLYWDRRKEAEGPRGGPTKCLPIAETHPSRQTVAKVPALLVTTNARKPASIAVTKPSAPSAARVGRRRTHRTRPTTSTVSTVPRKRPNASRAAAEFLPVKSSVPVTVEEERESAPDVTAFDTRFD